MAKILTIGGATQDIFINTKGIDTLSISKKELILDYLMLEQGSKIEIQNIEHSTGGGATNSAVSFARLNHEVSSCFKIAHDNAGEFIINKLTQENINVNNVLYTDKAKTASSFILPCPGQDYTALVYRGANKYLDISEINLDSLKNYNCVYITSLSGQITKDLYKIAQIAKENNLLVATNPGSGQLTKNPENIYKALKYLDILILNALESKKLAESILSSYPSIKQAIYKAKAEDRREELFKHFLSFNGFNINITDYFNIILNSGPKIVIVTNGKEGVYAATKDKIYFEPSIKTKVVSTLGAGDAFGSTFVSSILYNYSIEEALKLGVLNSASVISYLNAKTGLLSLKELKSKLKS